MSLLPNLGSIGSGVSDVYSGVATTSLRFNRADSPELSYTPSANAAGQKTYTLSVWVKLGFQFDQYRAIFGAGGGGNRDRLQIMNNQTLVFNINDGTDASLTTNALLRDPSAWYHIVAMYDTTAGATDTNRMKLYINGTEATYSATTYPDEDAVSKIGTNIEHFIGNSSADNLYFDGYLAEFNYTDGVANTPSAFGTTKNGVWVPKAYTGSYGQNGFRMKFDQVGVGTAGTTTIGADTSGLTNHLTSTNIVASDCAMPDSPENNFCTLNHLANLNHGSNHAAVHSEGNLKAVNSGDNISHLYGTFRINDFLTDGCYFEAKVTEIDNDRFYVGIIDPLSFTGAAVASYQNPNKALIIFNNNIYASTNTAGFSSYAPSTAITIGVNDIIGVAIKGDDVWFHVNGTYSRDASNNVGNPSTGANPTVPAITVIAGTDYFPYFGYASSYVVNFGQDPSFAGLITAGTETPDEGAGVFKYAVPTGFKAICSANLPEPTIGPGSSSQANDYFETVTYEGDGSTQNIAVNFKPDWTWIKNRDADDSHQVFDSTRTATYALIMDGTTVQGSGNDDTLTAFTTTGFSLGDDVVVNTDNEKYVSWNWKANGGTTSSYTATGADDAVTMQRNVDAGFSICQYAGSSNKNRTIGHGLRVGDVDTKPDMMIIKSYDYAGGWIVWHKDMTNPTQHYLKLDLVDATAPHSTDIWNQTAPTSVLVHLGNDNAVNKTGSNFISYFFASVEGYSKIDTFEGNGNANGTFVYTGFRPAWLMIKSDDSSSSWLIFDNKREGYNVDNDSLSGEVPAVEATTDMVDLLSNGFKARIATDPNVAETYVYMAFAEVPFKYANAR